MPSDGATASACSANDRMNDEPQHLQIQSPKGPKGRNFKTGFARKFQERKLGESPRVSPMLKGRKLTPALPEADSAEIMTPTHPDSVNKARVDRELLAYTSLLQQADPDSRVAVLKLTVLSTFSLKFGIFAAWKTYAKEQKDGMRGGHKGAEAHREQMHLVDERRNGLLDWDSLTTEAEEVDAHQGPSCVTQQLIRVLPPCPGTKEDEHVDHELSHGQGARISCPDARIAMDAEALSLLAMKLPPLEQKSDYRKSFRKSVSLSRLSSRLSWSGAYQRVTSFAMRPSVRASMSSFKVQSATRRLFSDIRKMARRSRTTTT